MQNNGNKCAKKPMICGYCTIHYNIAVKKGLLKLIKEGK